MTHRDPVCGMDVGSDTPNRSDYEGDHYYFCSAECKEAFDEAPDTYIVHRTG